MPILHSQTKMLKTYGKRGFRVASTGNWTVGDGSSTAEDDQPPSPASRAAQSKRIARRKALGRLSARRNGAKKTRQDVQAGCESVDCDLTPTAERSDADEAPVARRPVTRPRRRVALSPTPSSSSRSGCSLTSSSSSVGGRLVLGDKTNKGLAVVIPRVPPQKAAESAKTAQIIILSDDDDSVPKCRPQRAAHHIATKNLPRIPQQKAAEPTRMTQIIDLSNDAPAPKRRPTRAARHIPAIGLLDGPCKAQRKRKGMAKSVIAQWGAGSGLEEPYEDVLCDNAPACSTAKAPSEESRWEEEQVNTLAAIEALRLSDSESVTSAVTPALCTRSRGVVQAVTPDSTLSTAPPPAALEPGYEPLYVDPRPPELSPYSCPPAMLPLLETCQQSQLFDFTALINSPNCLAARLFSTHPGSWKKIGEATFSEVFQYRPKPSAAGASPAPPIVIKIIPVKSTVRKRGPKAMTDLALESDWMDVQREVDMSQILGTRDGFVSFHKAFLVAGNYPSALLNHWDDFKSREPDLAQNPRPSAFPAKQIYCLLVLSHGGVDLESATLNSWSEAASVFWQVARALGQAESDLEFEHRDLHWGNILVRRHTEDLKARTASGHPLTPNRNCRELNSPRPGAPVVLSSAKIHTSIIDFTLSRLRRAEDQSLIWSELEDVFGGEGDYQFQCYDLMKAATEDDWETFNTGTNVIWLHYLTRKLIEDKRLRKPRPAHVHNRSAQAPTCFASPGPRLTGRRRSVRMSLGFGQTPAYETVDKEHTRNEEVCYSALKDLEAMLADAVEAITAAGRTRATITSLSTAAEVADTFELLLGP